MRGPEVPRRGPARPWATRGLIAALTALSLCLASCDNATVRDVRADSPPLDLPEPVEVDAVVFLVGDAGASASGTSPLLDALAHDIETWSEALARDSAVSVVFLGDNVYPVGVRDRDHPDFPRDSTRLWNQIQLLAGPEALEHSSLGIFVAGNHDWGNTIGDEGLDRLQNLGEQLSIARTGGPQVALLPEPGAPGPVIRDLRSNVRLALLDTHWFLQARAPVDKAGFFARVDSALRTAEDRHVIIAEHHPYRSAGPHGDLVPGPGLLGLPFLLKKTGTLVQDLQSQAYHELLLGLRQIFIDTEKAPLIFAGGHDHSLQVLRGVGPYEPAYMLVSGSGSKLTPITAVPTMRYGASRPGYMMLVFRRDDGVQLFVVAGDPERLTCGGLTMSEEEARTCMDEAVSAFDIAYSETLVEGSADRLALVDETVERPPTPWWQPGEPSAADSVALADGSPAARVAHEEREQLEHAPPRTVPLRQLLPTLDSVEARPGETYPAGRLRRLLLGDLNRHLWEIPVKVPVLDLDSLGGGVTVDELSGGKQTLGLHLIGANGVRYQYRSIVKSPDRVLPEPWSSTPLTALLRDQMAAQFPLAALVVGELLDAAGVMVAKPAVVVLPASERLGEYEEAFAGRMGWIEVRPDERGDDRPGWAGSTEVTGSDELYVELAAEPTSFVDTRALIRARLVDMLVGDWDRHSDQWRWAAFHESERTRWAPIPRDRDWAFSRVDGIVPKLAGWLIKEYVGFDEDYPDIEHLTRAADGLETRLLGGASEEVYLEVASELRQSLTDSVLAAAVDVLPPPYLEVERERLLEGLRTRRDGLIRIAGEWYRVRARSVDVFGTAQSDRFEVEVHPDGTLTVRAGTADEEGLVRFERTFLPAETGTVRLHLTEDQDEVAVLGDASSPIQIERVPFVLPEDG